MNNQDSESKKTNGQKDSPDSTKKREDESREDADHLWDKTFTDNEDRNAEGYLSRTQRRRQTEHNSMITTVLVVLIIILALVPLVYWFNHREAFNHPATERTVRVASSRSVHHHHHKKSLSQAKKKPKKVVKHHHKAKKAKHQSVAHSSSQTVNSTSQSQQTASSSSSRANGSASSSAGSRTVTVGQGQGIYRVAANNGMSVSELEQMNGLAPGSEIHPGQQLRVK